jgi:hypothetical protein
MRDAWLVCVMWLVHCAIQGASGDRDEMSACVYKQRETDQVGRLSRSRLPNT